MGFCSNSTQEVSSNSIIENRISVANSVRSLNINVKDSSLKTVLNKDILKVDSYEDKKLTGSYFYDKGILQKEVWYNSSSKGQEQIVKYYYQKDGEYDRLEIIKGQDSSFDEFNNKLMRDFIVQHRFLESKNIEIPFSEIVSSEVRDLSNVFSVADNYDDFKREIKINGNQKTIKFTDFNKNIRFYPSTITGYIHDNDTIRDYELTLTDNHPSKEIYKTDVGELIKEFFYKDNKLVKLVYRFSNEKKQSRSLEKKFDYYDLK